MDTFCDVLAIHRWDTPVILPVGARSSLDDPICVFSEQFLRQPRTSLIWCIGCVSHTQPTTGSTSTRGIFFDRRPYRDFGYPFHFSTPHPNLAVGSSWNQCKKLINFQKRQSEHSHALWKMWCSITEMRWRCSVACIKCCKCIQIVLRIAMTVIGIRVSRRRSSSNTSTAVFTEEESSSRLSERTQEFSRWYAAVSREVESNKILSELLFMFHSKT